MKRSPRRSHAPPRRVRIAQARDDLTAALLMFSRGAVVLSEGTQWSVLGVPGEAFTARLPTAIVAAAQAERRTLAAMLGGGGPTPAAKASEP